MDDQVRQHTGLEDTQDRDDGLDGGGAFQRTGGGERHQNGLDTGQQAAGNQGGG